MSDLVSRLLAAIETEERDAPNIHHKDCRSVSYAGVTEGSECDCGNPAAVLRRCAADRELVEKYREIEAESSRVIDRGYAEPDEMVSERLAFEWVIKNRAASYGLSVEEETTQ